MKCIKCQVDSNLKDRTENNGRCKNCQHPFTFEPAMMNTLKITDAQFFKFISDISVNNTIYFNEKQFLYYLDLKFKKKPPFKTSQLISVYLIIYGIIIFISAIFEESAPLAATVLRIIAIFIYNIFWIFSYWNSSIANEAITAQRIRAANSLIILCFIILITGSLLAYFNFQFFNSKSFQWYFVTAAIPALVSLWLGILQRSKVKFLPNTIVFDPGLSKEWKNKWEVNNGAISYLLPSKIPSIDVADTPPSEITEYSFDRAIICDSSAIAYFLVANNFHFENNCAVLSIDGYPPGQLSTIMTMLYRNPDLQVYGFHGATPKGVALMYELGNNPNWFKDHNVKLIELGLSPKQILAMGRGFFIENNAESATAAKNLLSNIRQDLTSEEQEWLDRGNFVSLESISPQKLLKIAQRGISNNSQLGDDSAFSSYDSGSGISDGIYAAESFG